MKIHIYTDCMFWFTEKWFSFAILVAGFKSRSTPHDPLYSKKISIPTLHVFGETDKVIPKGKKRTVWHTFVQSANFLVVGFGILLQRVNKKIVFKAR